MVYWFQTPAGPYLKFDTDEATLLVSEPLGAGGEARREVYRQRGGAFVVLSVWDNNAELVVIDKAEAIERLTLAEQGRRTAEGERLLSENDISGEV